MKLPSAVVAPQPARLELPPEVTPVPFNHSRPDEELRPGDVYIGEVHAPFYQHELDDWTTQTRDYAILLRGHQRQSTLGYPADRRFNPRSGEIETVRTADQIRAGKQAELDSQKEYLRRGLGSLLARGDASDILRQINNELLVATERADEAHEKYNKVVQGLGAAATTADLAKTNYLRVTAEDAAWEPEFKNPLNVRAASGMSAEARVAFLNHRGRIARAEARSAVESTDRDTLTELIEPFIQQHETILQSIKAEFDTIDRTFDAWAIGQLDPGNCEADAEDALLRVNDILGNELAAPDGHVYDSAAREIINKAAQARFRLEQRRIAQDPGSYLSVAHHTPDKGIQFSDNTTMYEDGSINRYDGRGRRMADGSEWHEQPLPNAAQEVVEALSEPGANLHRLWDIMLTDWERTRTPQYRADALAVAEPYIAMIEDEMQSQEARIFAIDDSASRLLAEQRDTTTTATRQAEITQELGALRADYDQAWAQLRLTNERHNNVLYWAQYLRAPQAPEPSTSPKRRRGQQAANHEPDYSEPYMHENSGQEFHAKRLNGFNNRTWILYPDGSAHQTEDGRFYDPQGRAA